MNVYALVREVAEETASVDPHVIAKEAASRIAPKDRLAALEVALVALVRSETGLRSLTPILESAAISGAVGRSRKLDAYKVMAEKIRNARISIGNNVDKALGDCTPDDAEAAASIRESHAAATLKNAEKLRALAHRARQMHLSTLGELPDAELEAVWS